MNRLIATVALSVAALGSSTCRGALETPEAQAQEPVVVNVAPAVWADTAERLEAGGVVAAPQSATISSRLVATIVSVRVSVGDRVRAGDVLLTLDDRDVSAQVAQARAAALAAEKAITRARSEASAAEAEHRFATAWHQRMTALHARNSATDQERDEADARLSAASARVAGAQAAIEGADAHLVSAQAAVRAVSAIQSFTTARAPFDGWVTERLTDPGNLASPGIPLLRIESEGTREVLVRVDAARAGYINVGDRVTVTVDSGETSAGADSMADGVVAEVARAIAVDERAFIIKVTLPSGVTARSGSFARVVFRGAPRRALLVPATAVQRRGQVSSVYVVQDGVARMRLIQVGISTPQGIEVLAGLDADEQIVTPPLERLFDGISVTVTTRPVRGGGAS
jgi:RND family efflux transporter MFP subunit